MNKNRIYELLRIKYPIFQGGMAWVADANIAAAGSNAGGLRIIAGMNLNKEDLKKEIDKLRTLTDKPFGVNVMLMSPYVEEVAELIIEEKVPVVTTGVGNPLKYLQKWLNAGVKVIPVVASVSLEELSALGTGTLRKAAIDGDLENGSFLCGQVAGLVKVEQTCEEIIKEIITEATSIFNKFN